MDVLGVAAWISCNEAAFQGDCAALCSLWCSTSLDLLQHSIQAHQKVACRFPALLWQRDSLANRLTWLPMVSCPPMLKGVLARLIGLSAGKRPPLPSYSSPSELCRQSEWVLGQGVAWGCALGLCPDCPAQWVWGSFWMNTGTPLVGQAECHVEAHAGRRPTSLPWVLASL